MHGRRQRLGRLRFLDTPTVPDTGSGTPPIVDMGAYEGGVRPGDIDGDGYVDVVDLLYLVNSWGKVAGGPGFDMRCDFNEDGAVDVVDLLDLVYNFGT